MKIFILDRYGSLEILIKMCDTCWVVTFFSNIYHAEHESYWSINLSLHSCVMTPQHSHSEVVAHSSHSTVNYSQPLQHTHTHINQILAFYLANQPTTRTQHKHNCLNCRANELCNDDQQLSTKNRRHITCQHSDIISMFHHFPCTNWSINALYLPHVTFSRCSAWRTNFRLLQVQRVPQTSVTIYTLLNGKCWHLSAVCAAGWLAGWDLTEFQQKHAVIMPGKAKFCWFVYFGHVHHLRKKATFIFGTTLAKWPCIFTLFHC